MNCLAVGLGGFAGAVLRYLIGLIPTGETMIFPVKTFCINVIGCIVIGAITVLAAKLSVPPRMILFLKVGVCGGFTTFSTFALESSDLIRDGHTEIFGAEIGTLIYGAGKGIIRSFQDFDLCAEPYMKHPENTIYYFGDLDYEGIGIYENLAEKFRSRWKILPFVPAYQAMLGKAEQITELPETKEHQNRNISTQFFSCFDEIMVKKMEAVLDKDRYIPQEILNTADF